MKKLLAAATFAITATMGLGTAATAEEDSFGLSPEACAEYVAYFLEDRLFYPRSARIQLNGDPYRVMVNANSGGAIDAWAQDIRVKSRLPGGSWSNYQSHTVIFKDGQPIALDIDVSRISAI